MTFTQRWVLAVGIVLFLSVIPVRAQEQDSVIKIEATLVSIPVTVSDRSGRYLSGLKAEDFTLYKDGTKQQIAFFSAEEEPLNVALLLDTSRSTEQVLDEIKEQAKNFLKQLRPQDRAMIISFDYDVHVLSELTADRKALERAIKNARIGERVGTTLRDAVFDVTAKHFKQVTGRKAIIMLTDGKDHGSDITIDELFEAAEESDTMIYSIFYTTMLPGLPPGTLNFPRRRDWPPADQPGRRRNQVTREAPQFPERRQQRRQRQAMNNEMAGEFLKELSEVSAGRFYESDITDLKKTFALIADELRHQYRLGFYPSGERQEGITHKVRVEVSRGDAVVRARRSYQD